MQGYYHLSYFDPNQLTQLIVAESPLCSASFAKRQPELKDHSFSPYEILNSEKNKEGIFEDVREKEFPGRSPRKGAFFLFDCLELAKEKNQCWFHGGRAIVKVEIVDGNRFRADSQWLNCKPENYHQNARNYWAGELSANPEPEIILEGLIRIIEIIKQ